MTLNKMKTSFNRTIKELKRNGFIVALLNYVPFNRTIKELKRKTACYNCSTRVF